MPCNSVAVAAARLPAPAQWLLTQAATNPALAEALAARLSALLAPRVGRVQVRLRDGGVTVTPIERLWLSRQELAPVVDATLGELAQTLVADLIAARLRQRGVTVTGIQATADGARRIGFRLEVQA